MDTDDLDNFFLDDLDSSSDDSEDERKSGGSVVGRAPNINRDFSTAHRRIYLD
jgi:hypothetical protein